MRRLLAAACLILCLTVLAVCACTLIYIEGSSNSVTDTGGHSGTVAMPASAFDPSLVR